MEVLILEVAKNPVLFDKAEKVYKETFKKRDIWKGIGESWTDRIHFNFCEGPNVDNNVLFVYNPRFEASTVVRNTKDNRWGPEERDGGMPFEVGVTCELKIVVRSDYYECFVNGVKHIEYKHRMPMEKAAFFYIGGQGEIYNLVFEEEDAEEHKAKCMKDLTVPYNRPCRVFPGRKIYLSGTPTDDAKTFRAILKSEGDYAFSFAARINDNKIVMNNKIEGDWKEAETISDHFPFKAGQFCNVTIEVETDKFKVLVNDQPFAEFKHRVPLSEITKFHVDGQIELCSVKMD